LDFNAAVAELDALVQTLEREGDERALLMLELVDAIHRPALERIVAGDQDDPVAATVLSMYGLGPVDEALEAEEALDGVREYVESHGGQLELLGVDDGVVHVRLSGSCESCPGSTVTLKRGVEEALRAEFEGFRELVAHEPEVATGGATASGPQLLQIGGLKRPTFVEAARLDELPDGALRAVEVDGVSLVLARVVGEVYAFRNGCPMDDRELPLEGGRLTGSVLVCPWHNCAYDARSGHRLDDPGSPGLRVVPVAVRDGDLKVAVNVA